MEKEGAGMASHSPSDMSIHRCCPILLRQHTPYVHSMRAINLKTDVVRDVSHFRCLESGQSSPFHSSSEEEVWNCDGTP